MTPRTRIPTIAHNCHGKSKSLTAKANRPRQKRIALGKSKSLTAKANRLRQKRITHGKNKSPSWPGLPRSRYGCETQQKATPRLHENRASAAIGDPG